MKYILLAILALVISMLLTYDGSAVTVKVVDTPQYNGTLKVTPGESRVYEDGSVDWQPAGNFKLQ